MSSSFAVFFWSEDEVNQKLWQVMSNAFEEVKRISVIKQISMRDAAYSLAIERLAEAMKTRGIFP